MIVHRHTAASLLALGDKLPIPATAIIKRLMDTAAPAEDTALEVCRMTMSHGHRRAGSNGDSLVVIIRDGNAITAMLRRSWDQPFTPDALRVARVASWEAN